MNVNLGNLTLIFTYFKLTASKPFRSCPKDEFETVALPSAIGLLLIIATETTNTTNCANFCNMLDG